MPAIAIGPFAISNSSEEAVDATSLNNLADASGGKAFIVTTFDKDQGKSFKEAMSSLSGRVPRGYEIGVVIPPGSTEPDIAIVGHPGAMVRYTRIGPLPSRQSVPSRSGKA
jgi:hypothetical protein